MLSLFRKFAGKSPSASSPAGPASTPPNTRIYAVGDIHGRLDLFEELIRAIEADDKARGPSQTHIVLLGDLIDRGPDSAGVVSQARRWAQERDVTLLMGNHEEMFLDSFTKLGVLRGFMRFGGQVTLMSYGVPEHALGEIDTAELQRIMTEMVPREDREFLSSFQQMVRFGDYLFVHAGVNPDKPLDKQIGQDCRWIREPFLSHAGDYGAVIVHGHTVTEAAELMPNRIGIDTGAYMSGKLTAIGLEGTRRWLIEANEDERGAITSFAKAA